jgi:hypothetical protein
MKKEDKDLLLRDLSTRLPYKVKVYGNYKYNNGDRIVDDKKIEVLDLSILDWFVNGIDIKPYLRPLSSMTEKEKKELKDLLDAELVSCYDFGYLEGGTLVEYISSIPYSLCIYVIDWLNAHHFDYRGLIEKGLAIEAPKDMYDIK